MTIWKFPFPIADRFKLRMPEGCKILSVQVQKGTPCVWALVEEEAPICDVAFVLYGTGHVATNADILDFVGTFQVLGGDLVFHLFKESA